jgi:CheY-like chemotaxis protein
MKLPSLLIVDDVAENLQILSELLRDFYKIKVAKSGEKALELLDGAELPDLILLDVMMPGISGFEVCERIKAIDHLSHIPVIFLTSLNEVKDETQGFRSGGADFITKPFNPDIVKARIKTHIDLAREKRKSEELLKILLPDKVINDLIKHGKYIPVKHDGVSILFCDFVGFTGITAMLSPETLIEELSEVFSAFDEICGRNNVVRIKTIGDAYMAASGLTDYDTHHADNLIQAGLQFIEFLNDRNGQNELKWRCRIGVHSGSVIAGIVGKTRFIYDVVGDDVNIAARVESNGREMAVSFTDETKSLLKSNYDVYELGYVNLKGKGDRKLYFVEPN